MFYNTVRSMYKIILKTTLLALLFFNLSVKADPVLVSQQPWGSVDDATAMDEVFGSGHWTSYSSYVDANTNFNSIFSANTSFVYLQGGAGSDLNLVNFLSIGSNNSSILNWVSNGGRILMESAGWNTDVSLGGVTLLNYHSPSGSLVSTGGLTQAGIETFTHYPIVNINRNGYYLAHNYIVADPGIQLITFIEGQKDLDSSIVPIVSGFRYGAGYILFSGLTLYRWHCSVDAGAHCNDGGFNLAGDGSSWLNNMITTFSDPVALSLAYSITYGPSVEDTNASLQLAAFQLRSAFNSQLAVSNLSLTHDCNLFDVKGLCISAGGRYTAIDNPSTNATAAVVTLGYKVNPNIRIGGFLDQNVNIHTPGSVNVSNKNPLMGLYAVWNKEASGLGYQLRLANTYQDKDVTSTRLAYGDTGQAGSGTATLNSQSYLAELSYAFQYQDKALIRPYFGLRYTRLKRDGYTEATTDTVTAPLAFDALSDRSTTALVGARVNYQATPKTSLTASLGIEQDLHHKVDNLTATNSDIGDLSPVAFNSNIKRTRPVASAGAYYDVTKAQRLSGTLTYQQLPFQSAGATSLYVNYMIGF